MIFTAFAHMFSVLFLKAYRKPRELTWVSGMLLMFLVMG
jgi:quinol-cytochrome oxidoreductase complex cytochrome b subunit